MAKTNNLKQLHNDQVELAKKTFAQYKDVIVEEFVEEFGGSYQTVDQVKDSWRTIFKYAPECEDFLKFRTRIFLRMLPSDEAIYRNPRFLRILVQLISDYLSVYIVRKDANLKRNEVTAALYETLFNKNSCIQKKKNSFIREKQRAWGLAQKERREAKEREAKEKEERKAKRQSFINRVHIEKTPEEIARLEAKQVRVRIAEKRKEIAKIEVHIQGIIRG